MFTFRVLLVGGWPKPLTVRFCQGVQTWVMVWHFEGLGFRGFSLQRESWHCDSFSSQKMKVLNPQPFSESIWGWALTLITSLAVTVSSDIHLPRKQVESQPLLYGLLDVMNMGLHTEGRPSWRHVHGGGNSVVSGAHVSSWCFRIDAQTVSSLPPSPAHNATPPRSERCGARNTSRCLAFFAAGTRPHIDEML